MPPAGAGETEETGSPAEPQEAEPAAEPATDLKWAAAPEVLEEPAPTPPVDGLPPLEATPAPEPEPLFEEPVAAAEPSAAPLESGYAFQVGAFRDKGNCDTVVQDLADRGYEPYVVEIRTPRRRLLHAVRIGRFPDRVGAAQAASAFERRERMATVVLPASF